MSSVTASVGSITTGLTSLALPKCTSSCTVGGVTYGFKSAATVAGSPIAAGVTAYSVTATDLGGNAASGSYSVTVDNTAPAVSAAVVSTSATSTPGWIKQGGTYIVYANATDGGAINTVKANVAGVTAGQTALSLSACTSSCTVGGVTYGYKSASKTADATLGEGPATFSITSTDKAANATTTPFSVTIDNTGAVGHPDDDRQHHDQRRGLDPQEWRLRFVRQRVRRGQRDLHGQGERLVDHQRADRSRAQRLLDRVHRRRCHVCLQECEQDGRLDRCTGGVSYMLALVDKANNSSTGERPGTADNTAPVFTSAAVATVDHERRRVPGAEPHIRRLRQCVGRLQRPERPDGQGQHSDAPARRPWR